MLVVCAIVVQFSLPGFDYPGVCFPFFFSTAVDRKKKNKKQSILPIVFFSWGKNYFQFTLILLFAIFFSVCLAKVFVDLKSPTA